MTEDLIAVFQLFGNAAEKVVHFLAVIVRVNYELVSLLLDTSASTTNTVQNVFNFFRVAVTDSFDQYSDWCQSLFSFLLYLFDTANAAVHWLCSVPSLLIEFIQQGFSAIVQLPFVAFHCLRSLVVASIAFICAVVYSIFETIISICASVVKLPKTLCEQVMEVAKETNHTSMIIIALIAAAVLYMWYTGMFSGVVSSICSLIWRLITKILYSLLYVFAPPIALAVRAYKGFQMFLATDNWLDALLYVFAPNSYIVRLVRHFWQPIVAVVTYVAFGVYRIVYRRFELARVLLPDPDRHPFSRPPVAKTRPNRNATEDEDRLFCCVCQDENKTILLQPCNHLCLCTKCAVEITGPRGTNQCPICRSNIRSYVDVYL
uniref:RING-type domain-containing protein n=1 Tax=Plectus sambesii TaxID=2011161 RepID=A0A914V8A2_9BILA